MKQFIMEPGAAAVISPEAAAKLIRSRDGDAALVYIYLLQNGGRIDEEEANKCLGLTGEQLSLILDTLRRLNLLGSDESQPAQRKMPADEPPSYTTKEIARGLERGGEFKYLVDETQRRLGKMLSQSDLSTLFGLYDNLGLPAEVLSLLITHCVERAHKKFGTARNPTMRQIEREAYLWEQKGVNTTSRAEEHLRFLEKRSSQTGQIMRALQISGRAPSVSEERYMHEWIDMGFDADAIYSAYDIAVVKTGGLNWSYMNSILKSWHQKNLHTPEQIAQGDKPPKKSAARGAGPQWQPGEQERRSLEWLKNYKPRKNQ